MTEKNELDRLLEGIPNQPPIEWSTGAWNGPLIELDADDPFGHMERLFSSGIHITKIEPPEQGWPIMAHCSICKKTVIVLSPYAAKPEEGDIWSLKGTCLDEDEHIRHNMYPQHDYPWPKSDGTATRGVDEEAYKHYWNPLGVPPKGENK
jgi:hypothetical protein